MTPSKAICFTGHREIPTTEKSTLWHALCKEIERQILQGATVFRAGGALGFDTMAALAVLEARVQHPDICLELILPCPSQPDQWQKLDRELYFEIISRANSYRYLSTAYYPGLLQVRNRALVLGADACIAYLRNSHGGGTAYTAALALRQGIELINLADLGEEGERPWTGRETS